MLALFYSGSVLGETVIYVTFVFSLPTLCLNKLPPDPECTAPPSLR